MPTYIDLDEKATEDQRVDLQLESGRELLVFAIDDLTGAPAIGREISITVSNPVKRELSRVSSHWHDQQANVDASGYCKFQGIPLDGQVSVSQDLDDGVGRRVLKRIHLDPGMPRVVECEVRIESTATVKTRVFGTLPSGPRSGSSGLRTVSFKSWSGGVATKTNVDENGHWSAELGSHQAWDAQAELNGKPHSDGKFLELKGEAEFGPVQLGWRGGLTLTLQLLDVPESGDIVIKCTELDGGGRQTIRLKAKGEDLEHELLLSGPATVEVAVSPINADSEFGYRRRIEVNPEIERVRSVNLGGSQARDISIRINGQYPIGECVLMLMIPSTRDDEPERVVFQLNDGHSSEPQVIDGGDGIFFVIHEGYPGLVIGWLDIPKNSAGHLSIDWRGATRPSAELGSGIEMQTLDDRDPNEWLLGFNKIPWTKKQLAAESLWLPTGLIYEVTQ
ncbi:MAG: hypothetical protein ACI8X5_000953 [Planctomycetota bacterium]